jgi:hypothetical protein
VGWRLKPRIRRNPACACRAALTCRASHGVNSFTFRNFRRLSPPLLKASLKWYDGHPLGDFQRDYSICLTPKDLADRCVLRPSSEDEDAAAINRDAAIPETTRKALVDPRSNPSWFT